VSFPSCVSPPFQSFGSLAALSGSPRVSFASLLWCRRGKPFCEYLHGPKVGGVQATSFGAWTTCRSPLWMPLATGFPFLVLSHVSVDHWRSSLRAESDIKPGQPSPTKPGSSSQAGETIQRTRSSYLSRRLAIYISRCPRPSSSGQRRRAFEHPGGTRKTSTVSKQPGKRQLPKLGSRLLSSCMLGASIIQLGGFFAAVCHHG
jgi:hypothetical protein